MLTTKLTFSPQKFMSFCRPTGKDRIKSPNADILVLDYFSQLIKSTAILVSPLW